MKVVNWAAIAASPLLFLASCSTFVQSTSGESYLARADTSGATLSDELRAAADSDLAPKLVDVVAKLELEMAQKSARGAAAR